jgi:hypothetical protein
MSAAPETAFTQTNALLSRVDHQLQPGGDFNLRGLMLPHYPIRDTALAAALATYGVPFREPGPYTDAVELDEKGNEGPRGLAWWMGDMVAGAADDTGKTEWLLGAWIERARFEADHPDHPFVAMRRAHDARSWWLSMIAAAKARAAILPLEHRGRCYLTDRIHAASVLKASGFEPLAFNGRVFALSETRLLAPGQCTAASVLFEAAQIEGHAPAQWMARFLSNYSQMVKFAKSQSVIIRQTFDDQTLLLSADAERKTRDKFHALL